MSDLVVIGLPEYRSTISGDLYDNVVYFLISSSISVTDGQTEDVGLTTFVVALP